MGAKEVGETSFRPLIGVSFCKLEFTIGDLPTIQVFVPLSGLVSVNTIRKPEKSSPVLFSSPYRG